MIDENRILTKIDEFEQYVNELEKIKPSDFEEYKNSIEKKRACERLLQIAIESVIDVCNILVSSLKLGVPDDEDALFDKLNKEKIISNKMRKVLSEMKGFRNVLVHKYGEVNDELVFENLDKLSDFTDFKEEVISFLEKSNEKKSKTKF